MKVLQLSYRLPYPLKDGGAIGIYNITRAFNVLGHDVTLMAFNTRKHYVNEHEIPEKLKKICSLISVDLNTNINPFHAILNLLQNKSYHISRFESNDFKQKLITVLQQNHFDLIQIEGAFMGVYLDIVREYSNAKIVVRAHNVEFRIWEKLASNSSFLKKSYLKILASQLKKIEIGVWQKADFVAAINQEEMDFINSATQSKKAKLFSAGIFPEDFEMQNTQVIPNSLFHIGSMEWLPNIEGVNWFLENVLPEIKKEINEVKLFLAGRKMPQRYFQMAQNELVVEGEVADSKQFMADKQLMVVPLLSGGGVRVKILEAMAMSKAIVATSQAAEGLNCTDGKDIVIADSAEIMKNKIVDLLNHPEKIQQLQINARLHVLQHYNQTELLKNFLQEISK